LSIVVTCREGPVASRARSVETVIVGAGQAGHVVSQLLSTAGREHVLLDRRSTLGGS
jgi:cation diffusion facilitator CzcD-associated flavoprotein CzcO